MMNSKAVFLTALMSVVLVGCSHTQPSRVAAPQAKAPSKELQVVKACDIFTQDIALGLFQPAIGLLTGTSTNAYMRGTSDFLNVCKYDNGEAVLAGNWQEISLMLEGNGELEEIIAAFNATRRRAKESVDFLYSEPITLEGIGDDAFITSDSHQIVARKGKYMLRLIRYKGEKVELKKTQEQFQATMVKILANLT